MNTSPPLRLLLLAALLPLVGCADSAKSGAAKPATTAPAGAGPTRIVSNGSGQFGGAPAPGVAATINEAEKGRTVHIERGESVAIRLGVDESTGNRWFLANRLEGNVLYKKGDTTYAPSSAGTVATLIYQGLRAGKQELHFTYAPPDARQNPSRTADFAVIVR